MTKPVLLSDFGSITSVSLGKEQLWNAVTRNDRSGIRLTEKAGAERYIAPVTLPETPDLPPPYDNRVNRLLHHAIEEIRASVDKAIARYGADRIAVCVGSCDNGSEESQHALGERRKNGAFPPGYTLEQQRADLPARFTAWSLGTAGPCISYSTACASSASALVSARALILSGQCDAAVAGGADIVSDAVALGFGALEAVSDEPCNPFSANRKGISLGEAAALFLVTREDFTGSGIMLAGAGESADAHHMTAPEPEGTGALLAMERALENAGYTPRQIDYLNLHGTGTRLNDAMESRAVSKLFSRELPASSTKGITGHTLGAAGALEAGICWLALSASNTEKLLPAHRWDGIADPELPPLSLVSAGQTAGKISACMTNSFAFGGCNVSLILAKTL